MTDDLITRVCAVCGQVIRSDHPTQVGVAEDGTPREETRVHALPRRRHPMTPGEYLPEGCPPAPPPLPDIPPGADGQ